MDAPPPNETDAAWASVELAVPADHIRRLLANPVLLLRINPCLEFERLEQSSRDKLSLAAINESNGCRIATDVRMIDQPSPPQLALHYATGIKRETRFAIEPVAGGARLTITETYGPPGEGSTSLDEVDRSLLPWTAALRRHLKRGARFGWLPGYARLVEGFWLSMPPRQRRIAWLIIWTTPLEFVLFGAVLAIYLTASR